MRATTRSPIELDVYSYRPTSKSANGECPGSKRTRDTRMCSASLSQRYFKSVDRPFALRPATSADVAGIARVAIDTDQAGEGAGADASYVHHLLTRGTVVVATTDDVVIGYAATVRIAEVDMLADLFISPDWQGKGMGGALLSKVWSDAPDRMTLSSTHPAALPLYVRFGMAPILPVLYVSGEPFAYSDGLTFETISAHEAAQAETDMTGLDRSNDYVYWAKRPRARCFVIRRGGALVGVGALGGDGVSYGVSHCVSVSAGETTSVALTAAAALESRGFICVPGPSPALPELLQRSWRIIDSDLFMGTRPDLIDPELLMPHSGLM